VCNSAAAHAPTMISQNSIATMIRSIRVRTLTNQ
jgi:hypothetical protein